MRRPALLLAVLLAIAGCGDDDDALEVDVEEVGAFDLEVEEGDPAELAAVVEERLSAAGFDDASVEATGSDLAVEPGAGPLDQFILSDLVTAPGELEFRPVLQQQALFDEAAECESGSFPLEDPRSCLDLGPAAPDIEVEGADVVDSQDLPGVSLDFSPVGLEAFNAIARTCFEREAACPSGQLAIVVDGGAISAPSIQQPEFEDGQVEISSSDDSEEQVALAALVSGGPLPGSVTEG